MTEFLLRVHDQVNLRNPFMNQRLTKRGDIIVALPDGWEWGPGETTAPFWRIVVADIPADEALGWTAEEEYSDSAADVDIVWKRKAMWMRLDRVTGDFATWLAQDTRPSGNIPDRIVSGEHNIVLPNENGVRVPTRAYYSHRVPMWGLRAEEMRQLMERKPAGPPRTMVAGAGYVVRSAR